MTPEELREGWLHNYAHEAFLPGPDLDAMMARLASGPARAGDLAVNGAGAWHELARTLLWLKKFGMVDFVSDPQAD